MKAVIFDGELKLADIEKPKPKFKEVLIKTSLGGICNTDYEITKGYMGFNGVLGHEFVGIVKEVGPEADSSWIGKRVVGGINLGCHSCSWCNSGLERHCPNRQTLGIYNKDGCFSEYFTLRQENLIEVPKIVSDMEAVFTEPLAAACEILEQVHIEPMQKVAILGDGKLGLCIAQVLNAHNLNIVHIGKHDEKLAISRHSGIATMSLEDALKHKKEFDVVIEATGSVGGFETSVLLTRPRGRLILKSTIAASEGLNLSGVVVDEITIIGSRCGQFAPALRLLERKVIDVKNMVSKIYDVNKAMDAFEANKRSDVIKVLIKF